MLGVLAALVVAGCATESTENGSATREAPFIRLVSELYQSSGDPSMAEVPTAVVGGVRKPVLSASLSVTLSRSYLEASEDRRVAVEIPIPEFLHGAPLQLMATLEPIKARFPFVDMAQLPWRILMRLTAPPIAPSYQEPRIVLKPGAQDPVIVEVDRGEITDTASLLTVVGRRAPASRVEIPALVLPAGAQLRFSLGVEDLEGRVASIPATFTVILIDEEGSDETVHRERLDPIKPGARGWIERTVDLSRFGGKSVRLRFVTKIETKDADVTSTFPVWGDPTVVRPVTEGPLGRNVLLISLDTLRADHLGCYGYERPTSPTIDARIAARGTLFEQAYTSYPSTELSHMTLLTSLDPCAQGMTDEFPTLRADALTLAEHFRAAGFRTAAFTEDAWVTAETGFARGFDSFVEDKSRGVSAGQADTTFAAALEWIRKHSAPELSPPAPWFVFVHTYQVHEPYRPPRGYLHKVAPEEIEKTRAALDAARYDAEIRYTDDLLAKFLDGLAAAGIDERTLLILTADHGEQFGEHGRFRHNNSLFESVLRVPLIFRAPGLIPEGRRIRTPVGLVDVVPTLLDLLELPPTPLGQGMSLRPLIDLRGDKADGERALAQRTLFAQWKESFAARRGGMKWIVREEGEPVSLFDIDDDPAEEFDLIEEQSEDAIDAVIAEFRNHCASVPPPPEGMERTPDRAVVEKLKALGYLE